MMRAVLLDDDLLSLRSAEAALKEFPEVTLVGRFQEGASFFDYLSQNPVDLVFLDIELKEETGFQAARRLKEEFPSVMIIFLTGHSSYAIDGYDFSPVGYLTKPISREKLRQALERAEKGLRSQTQSETRKILFKCIQGYRMIPLGEICYVERRNRKNYLVCTWGELQIAYYTMAELLDLLEPYGFCQCHQSFLVAVNEIVSLEEERRMSYVLRLKDRPEAVPLGRTYYESVRRLLAARSEQRL